MEVVLEDDATPLVMIIGTTLRRAATDPALARRAEGLKGVFALKSEKDPQAVTMRFDGGRVALSRGVAPDADVVVTVDLDNMSGPDAAKPKVHGALRHPKFALDVSKLLDAPAKPWPELARAFWAFAGEYPGMPESLRIVGLDDGTTLDLGTGAPVYEIHGTAAALTSIFGGGSVFGQDLLDGKVYAIGSMKHASILTGRSIEWTMRGAS
jgi:hypothetical protein